MVNKFEFFFFYNIEDFTLKKLRNLTHFYEIHGQLYSLPIDFEIKLNVI